MKGDERYDHWSADGGWGEEQVWPTGAECQSMNTKENMWDHVYPDRDAITLD